MQSGRRSAYLPQGLHALHGLTTKKLIFSDEKKLFLKVQKLSLITLLATTSCQ
jgi:hypothetical protein